MKAKIITSRFTGFFMLGLGIAELAKTVSGDPFLQWVDSVAVIAAGAFFLSINEEAAFPEEPRGGMD